MCEDRAIAEYIKQETEGEHPVQQSFNEKSVPGGVAERSGSSSSPSPIGERERERERDSDRERERERERSTTMAT